MVRGRARGRGHTNRVRYRHEGQGIRERQVQRPDALARYRAGCRGRPVMPGGEGWGGCAPFLARMWSANLETLRTLPKSTVRNQISTVRARLGMVGRVGE